MVEMKLNGRSVEMEVDTGAACTVMSRVCYDRIGGSKLKVSKIRLRTYTGQLVTPLGEGLVEVVYGKIRRKLPILVLEGKIPTLLGRN